MKERRERAEKISRQQEKENSTGKISLSVEQEVEQQAGSLGLRGSSSQVLPDTQDAIAPWEVDDRPFASTAPIPVLQPSELSLEEIWELALDCLGCGEFDLDPCRSGAPAKEIFDPVDGLSQNWNGKAVFLFPPHAQSNAWIENLLREYDAGNIEKAVVLVRADLSQAWFHGCFDYPTCLLHERVNANGNRWQGAAFALGDIPNFAEVFGRVGTVVQVLEE
jgi:hypothetical protein